MSAPHGWRWGVSPADGDPPGAPLAPTAPDGGVAWEELVDWRVGSVRDQGSATANVADRIARLYRAAVPGWRVRTVTGEGVTVRWGKGSVRGDGTRPRMPYLAPCTSLSLRAQACEDGFPDTHNHVVVLWSIPAGSGRMRVEGAWCWCDAGDVGDRRVITVGPTRITVSTATVLLRQPPSVAAITAVGLAARCHDDAVLGRTS